MYLLPKSTHRVIINRVDSRSHTYLVAGPVLLLTSDLGAEGLTEVKSSVVQSE